MDPRHLELAHEFCEMVSADDLLAFLGLEASVDGEAARKVLKKKRSWYQSMQANPKHRERAKYFIKHYRAFDALLAEPQVHIDHEAKQRAAEKLPMLEMAIDSVLADGKLTPQEEAFVRDNALSIGISEELFEQVLEERLAKSGASRDSGSTSHPPPPAFDAAPPPPPPAFGTGQAKTLRTAAPEKPMPRKRPKAGQGWWNQKFTNLLLQGIPKGTSRMVDIACGSAWAALALLPERPGLEYLGVDRDKERLELARRSLQASPIGRRVALIPGEPHDLPLEADSVDVVIAIMSLRFFDDTTPIFAEAARVLREGGRFLVVEPDGLSQHFYFDGHLELLNRAYQSFMRAADRELGKRRTGDIVGRPGLALGPELGMRMRHAGLKPHKMVIHPIQGFKMETIAEFADRAGRNIDAVAHRAGLSPSSEPVVNVRKALNMVVDTFGPEEQGLGGHLQPAFLCVGVKL